MPKKEVKKVINKKQELTVYIPERMKEGGVYSNITNITVSDNEVIINFIYKDPTGASLVSKVIVSPAHAKSLHKILGALLKKHSKSSNSNK